MKERKYIQVTTTTELIPVQTVTEYTVPEYFTDEDWRIHCDQYTIVPKFNFSTKLTWNVSF